MAKFHGKFPFDMVIMLGDNIYGGQGASDLVKKFSQPYKALLDRGVTAARDAVARTPDMLPVLKEAGVVDAGGRGFALLLDAFQFVVSGRKVPDPEVVNTPASVEAHQRGDDIAGLRYEIMFMLHADDATIPAFKQTWGSIGDSIVVVGGDGLWNCHVHTNDIGAAVEAGIEAGRPANIHVTDLVEQVENLASSGAAAPSGGTAHLEGEAWVRDAVSGNGSDGAGTRSMERVTTAVVAVAVGAGLERLLRSVGVHEVIAGGQSMNPSTAQILEAVDRAPADAVIVLPNNKNIVAVAQQVDGLTELAVGVVPTHSVVEALTALVSYDPDASLSDNLVAMNEAASRVRAGEVTQAVRDSTADCGPIAQGDWIALGRDGVCAVAATAVDATIGLLRELVEPESELVTVLVGAGARAADTARIRDHLGLDQPHVEVEVHEGGQPLYPYLIGVE